MMPSQTKSISAALTIFVVVVLSACSTLQHEQYPPPLPAPAKGDAARVNAMPGPLPPGATVTQVHAKDALVLSGTGNFVKPTPPQPALPSGPEEFSLNFEATDIRAIVQSIMGDYLRESFTIHPATTGTGTIRLSKPVSRKDLIPILEMMLRQNGQIMLREEGLYKIMPAAQGTRGSITPQAGGTTTPLPAGFSVQIVQLKFVGAVDMQRILGPYVTDPAASVQIDAVRNLIIISGTQRELRHLFDIIDLFDVDFLAGYSVGLFQMSTDVKALSADLDRIFGTAAQSPLAGIVRIIPIERMNGLLVVTTQAKYLEEAKKWIERLDRAGGATGGMRLNVYAVQHGKAEKLAQLLSEVYGSKQSSSGGPTLAPGQRPAQIGTAPTVLPGQPAAPPQATAQSLVAFSGSGVSVSKDVKIIADNDNNALLILASPSDYETIQSALRQLDVARRQVSVEVLVAEVTLNDELKFGIEWFVNARNNTLGSMRDGATALPTLPGLLDAAGKAFDPRTVVKGTSGLQLINIGPGGDIRAVLHALGTDGRSRVISTPRVMVLDNEKATINVGDQISVDTGASTGTSTGGTVVTTRQYLSTGVILSVTPRINAGGRVTLDVNQEVSAPGEGTNPTISTRKAQTVVTVSSGETMVLAGLISELNTTGSTGLPLLSKIPLIGGLFGSQSLIKRRTELVLLITPTVVTSPEDARAVTDEIRKKLPSLEGYLPKSIK
ncbi:MAG: type II secretion system secretin GspD [Betaproteobacteria bacterium]|nr:type II secretion system secretin GspD [Betaproteobacteria bacterium]